MITVEEGKSGSTTLELADGMQFDKGYISPYFVTSPEDMSAELEDCLILLHEKKVANLRDLIPLLEKISRTGRPLLIISEDVESEATDGPGREQAPRRVERVCGESPRFWRTTQGHDE